MQTEHAAATRSVAEEYVRAINDHDAAAFVALFAEQAEVDDAGRLFHGREAIQHWSGSDIFAANVTVEVRGRQEHSAETVLTTKVDGNFDRTGLPDPVIITHQITVADGKIARLACRLAPEAVNS